MVTPLINVTKKGNIHVGRGLEKLKRGDAVYCMLNSVTRWNVYLVHLECF